MKWHSIKSFGIFGLILIFIIFLIGLLIYTVFDNYRNAKEDNKQDNTIYTDTLETDISTFYKDFEPRFHASTIIDSPIVIHSLPSEIYWSLVFSKDSITKVIALKHVMGFGISYKDFLHLIYLAQSNSTKYMEAWDSTNTQEVEKILESMEMRLELKNMVDSIENNLFETLYLR